MPFKKKGFNVNKKGEGNFSYLLLFYSGLPGKVAWSGNFSFFKKVYPSC